MGLRRRSREFALQIMFQKEFSPNLSAREILQTYTDSFKIEPEVSEYGLILIMGVDRNKSEIDSAIQSVSKNWKLSRMALVDLNIARIGVFEMLYLEPALPAAVAINEALEVAKKYGSVDSPAFVNGVLDQLTRAKAQGAV